MAKLERRGVCADILVWCDAEADIPATVKAMIAAGEITDVRFQTL